MQTVYSSKHHLHAASELADGKMVASFECPERAEIILHQVREQQLGEVLPPQAFDLSTVTAVHDAAYIEFLRSGWRQWRAAGYKGELLPIIWPGRSMPSREIPQHIEGKAGYYCLSVDTSITEGTWEAARASANVVLTAAQRLVQGESAVFALCRPPGHHAAADAYGGYCFINNAAVGAQWLCDQGASKVAILDVDFHHGNGTQSIFYQRADVLFQSIHGEPQHCFPYFSGYANETGEGAGQGFNFNYPLPPGTSYQSWKTVLYKTLDNISEFAPDYLVVSLGVDTFEHDPISDFKLKTDDFKDLGAQLAQSGLPALFVMEGGYAVEATGINTLSVLTAFRT